MPEMNVLLAALICCGIGASVLLLVVALRGTVLDPTRPPNRLETLLERPRSPLLLLRLAAGVLLAILIFVVTRWPVAAVGLGGLVAFWPALMGGSKDEQQQIVRLEAVVTWCESLRDTTIGHAGLEQAIPATAANAAPAIRPALLRLTGQLRSKVPLDQALQDLAEQLNHSADLIIAALQMNVRARGDGLVGVLTNLAVAGREELDLRRKITAGRAGDRRAVQLMLVIVLAVATFLVLFSRTYTAPYRSVAGQIALAVVIGLFATSFAWIRKLAMAKPATPFLPRAGKEIDPMEQRIISALTTGPEPASAAPAARHSEVGAR
jgi:tight adherence protein B